MDMEGTVSLNADCGDGDFQSLTPLTFEPTEVECLLPYYYYYIYFDFY